TKNQKLNQKKIVQVKHQVKLLKKVNLLVL
ncbi:C5a peptidase, partial [Streptococcus dysgalactiae subsp. equisimilis]